MDQLEQLIVKARSRDTEVIPLSPLDIYLGHFITGGVYFFLKVPELTRLKQALALALEQHPSFGASMVREANSIGLHSNEAGIEFSIYRSDFDCPDLRSTRSLITRALLANDDLVVQPDNIVVTDFAGNTDNALTLDSSDTDFSRQRELDAFNHVVANSATHYAFNQSLPVVRLRMVMFRDKGCALVIHHVHSLGDGMAMMTFLCNWSKIYRSETLLPLSGYARAALSNLAATSMPYPSAKLNIIRKNADLLSTSEPAPECRDSIRIDIAQSTLDNFVHHCRLQSTLALSSSDIIHALAWKGVALTQRADDSQIMRLYTLFDLRSVSSLGIPADYIGSAVLGRWAEATYSELRTLAIVNLAASFRRQTKPMNEEDIRQDIGYLANEYNNGYLDEQGNYSRFTIAAWIDCRSAKGLIVNDLRKLPLGDFVFEERAARMETLVGQEINMVSVYPNDDGTITLHYVGERMTLVAFSDYLRENLAMGDPHHSLPLRR